MKYAIYLRKSTDTEDKQVLSLESQESELKRLALLHGLDVVETLQESRSAKEPGRPVFNYLMDLVSSGKVDAILCWKIDRLTRNPVDGGQIQWFLQNGKIKCITTFEKNYYPNDNVLLMSIEQAMASQYIRDLSTNVKRGNRAKLERGEWPNHAPFGYYNDKATKTVKVDKKLAPYVVRTFELCIAGKNYQEISNALYEEGLRTESGRKVFKSQIQRTVLNPFYYGMMLRDGKYYEGKHETLISKHTFDSAQEISLVRSRPKSQSLFFPLRGFLTCHNCGCNLTASLKKGHHYYYCTDGKKICEEHKGYMRENYLYEEVSKIFDDIHISEAKIELMYQAAKELQERKAGNSMDMTKSLKASLDSLKSKESRLLDTFIAEQITKELYDKKTLELHNERISLSKQIKDLEMNEPAFTLEPVKKVFLEANRTRNEFLNGNDTKKKEVLEKVLWNLSLENKKIVTVKYKSVFAVMSKMPKNAPIHEMLSGLDSNQNKRYQKPLSYH